MRSEMAGVGVLGEFTVADAVDDKGRDGGGVGTDLERHSPSASSAVANRSGSSVCSSRTG